MNHPAAPTPSPRPSHGEVGVIQREDRFLVIRRSQFVRAPGRYCFPGGGIHDGEEERAALLRELREELNVDVEPVERLWSSVTPWGVALAWWRAILPADQYPEPNLAEVESIHWLDTAAMLALPELLESNRQFLEWHASSRNA